MRTFYETRIKTTNAGNDIKMHPLNLQFVSKNNNELQFCVAIWRSGILHAATCHHMRAVEYFTASVRQECLFPAFPCSSWKEFKEGKCFNKFRVRDISLMGMQAEQCKKYEQPMYLTTLAESPFCGS